MENLFQKKKDEENLFLKQDTLGAAQWVKDVRALKSNKKEN